MSRLLVSVAYCSSCRRSPTTRRSRSRRSTWSSSTSATARSTGCGGGCWSTSTPTSSASPPPRASRRSGSSSRTSSRSTPTRSRWPTTSTSTSTSTGSGPRSASRARRSRPGTVVPKVDRRTRAQRLRDARRGPRLRRQRARPRRHRRATRSARCCETFRDRLFTEIFPGRTDGAQDADLRQGRRPRRGDRHTVREVFGKGNDFAAKITYNAPTNAEELLAAFRTSPTLRDRRHRRHDRHRHRRQAAGVRVLHARRPLAATTSSR